MPAGDGRRKITEGETISECEVGSTIPQMRFKMEQKRKRKSLQRQVFFPLLTITTTMTTHFLGTGSKLLCSFIPSLP